MGRTDVVAEVIAAEPASVWAALVDADALLRWLPPAGARGRFEHVDLRPGGGYRLVLTFADPAPGGAKNSADEDVVEARIVELVRGQRLVQAVDFVSDDPRFGGTMTMTWSLSGSLRPRARMRCTRRQASRRGARRTGAQARGSQVTTTPCARRPAGERLDVQNPSTTGGSS